MGAQLAEEQLAGFEVEDEEARLGGREGVVDDGEQIATGDQPLLLGISRGVEGQLQRVRAETGRLPQERADERTGRRGGCAAGGLDGERAGKRCRERKRE